MVQRPIITPSRRRFMAATGSAFAALVASGCTIRSRGIAASAAGYGDLVPDPGQFIDLPAGFSYRVISALGDTMDDGGTVPDSADGMGCFDIGGGKIALVRNHELKASRDAGGPITTGYDMFGDSGRYMPGGTTTLLLDAQSLKVERQYRSLGGTIRNCAGGTTPWGSWLTCEEDLTLPGKVAGKRHGYVFEVPANAPGIVDAVPLVAMGRFNHEAACVDPATGAVYQTEDRDDGLFYRFLPAVPGQLAKGGRLQALALGSGTVDTRNRHGAKIPVNQVQAAHWINLQDVDTDSDDLRIRGAAAGAALFARGEGLHMGDGEMYFTCTSGGAAGLGQVFRLRPGGPGKPDALDLFFESTSTAQFNFGDNLTVAPSGHLIVCEDQYTDVTDNHLRGIAPDGRAYPLALLHRQTEWAGACFSPDGKWLFVNVYSPAATIAITGPWIV